MKHLVSIRNYPWLFVTISLDVKSEHWVGSLQTVGHLQFVCWEDSPKWIFWCARVLSCVYHLFSKDIKLQSFCLSTIESVYLTVLFWMLGLQTLLLYIQNIYVQTLSFSAYFSPVDTRSKRLPNLISMHLFTISAWHKQVGLMILFVAFVNNLLSWGHQTYQFC